MSMLRLVTTQKYRQLVEEQQQQQQQQQQASASYFDGSSSEHPHFKHLPPEIIFSVFFFLNRNELITMVAPVCRLWYDLANHKQLWWHHTFINNPYYFENRAISQAKLLNNSFGNPNAFFSEKNIALYRAGMASSPAETPTTPITPASPTPPVVVVNAKAQIYSYKHYFYNINRMSSKKKEDPRTLIHCKDYYFEHLLLNKFTKSGEPGSQESKTGTPGSATTPLTPTGTGATPSTPSRATSFFDKLPSFGSIKGFFRESLFERDEDLEKKITTNSAPTSIPAKRYRHTITVVPRGERQQLYLIGGIRTTNYVQAPEVAEDEVFVLDCASPQETKASIYFKTVKVKGKPPHIGKHSAVLFGSAEQNNLRIVIFGGVENDVVTNHLYIFDLQTNTWTHATPQSKTDLWPSPRTNHQAVSVGNEMYVVGGGIGQNMVPTQEVWAFDTDALTWRQIKCSGLEQFTPRLGFAMAKVNQKILIYGGGYWYQNNTQERYWKEKYTDLFIFDIDTNTFVKIETTGPKPLTGTFPAFTLVGSQWFIIGGAYENEISNEIYSLDTITFTWRKVEHKFYGGDSLAASHFTHAGENKIMIFGGYCYHPLSNLEIFKLKYLDILERKGLHSLSSQKKRGQRKILI